MGPLTSLFFEGLDASVFWGKGWVGERVWYKAGDTQATDGQTQEEGPAQASCDFGALVLIHSPAPAAISPASKSLLPRLPLHS